MATFAPTMAMTAVMPVMPEYMLISSTMSVALNEYSTQRKRLMPPRRSDSYRPRATVPVSRWSSAARKRNAGTAQPMRTSNSA